MGGTRLKLALAQIDTTIGAVEENARRVLDGVRRAVGEGADFVAFPELTLTGYPPLDLLERPAFVDRNVRALEGLATELGSLGALGEVTVVVGYAAPTGLDHGKRLFNAAAVLQGGEIVDTIHKALLPTYDVFSEARHFEPERLFRPVTIGGRRIGLTICEDIWVYDDEEARRLYAADPVAALAEQGVELLLNISASPYSIGRPRHREELGRKIARQHGLPVALVNLVGGNDSLIFDGTSYVLGADGAPLGRAKSFAEDLLVVDLAAPAPRQSGEAEASPPLPEPPDEEHEVIEALALGLRDYVEKTGFESVLVGLSGGIDSSVVCALAARALGPERVTGIAMPGPYSSDASLEDARALAEALGVRFDSIPIVEAFESYRTALRGEWAPSEPGAPDLAEENIQARIRGNILMAISNRFGHLVLSTGNKSEMAVGYCTLYGDMSGGLAVLSDVPKTLVYRIARALNAERRAIPERCIQRPPSAELRPDQTDQDSLPSYKVLDPILEAHIEEMLGVDDIVARGHDAEVVRRVVGLVERNEYKRRQMPIGLRITMKAFGVGRCIPIARETRP